jgi:hypothetical protein
MNIFELYDLATWYRGYFKALRKAYSDLHNAVSNNANQPSKLPLEEPLTSLVEFLHKMTLNELSLQQMETLKHLGVEHLLGADGALWVETTIKKEAYDPATAERAMASAVSAVNSANEKLSAYSSSIDQMELRRPPLAGGDDTPRVTVRVGFKNDAAIENVKDLRTSAEDWFQIVRGLALVSGEAPENTKVVGASSGSIIVVLSVTYAISKLLATIAKHITGTAKEILELQITLEDLRQKKILTKTMEEEFKKLKQEKKDGAIEAIKVDIAKQLPKAGQDGEKSTALEKSIQKLLKFGEDGGDIDFVAPSEPSQDPAGADAPPDEMIATMRSVRNLILEYQAEREAVKLLSHERSDEKAAP